MAASSICCATASNQSARDPKRPWLGLPFECRRCGASVIRRHKRELYCRPCAPDAMRERAKEKGWEKSRAEGRRQLKGVTLRCVDCANEFSPKAHNQQRCPDCKKAGGVRQQIKRLGERCKVQPHLRLNRRMSNVVRICLKGGKSGRAWSSLVGYSLADLIRHLERQFLPGMSWENRALWHVDHIVPLASFTFTTPDDPEFQAAWALTNLRPLWKPDNLKKNAKRIYLL